MRVVRERRTVVMKSLYRYLRGTQSAQVCSPETETSRDVVRSSVCDRGTVDLGSITSFSSSKRNKRRTVSSGAESIKYTNGKYLQESKDVTRVWICNIYSVTAKIIRPLARLRGGGEGGQSSVNPTAMSQSVIR